MPNKEKTLLFRWYNEVWNNGNENAIHEMMDEEHVAHGIGEENKLHGIEAFKSFYKSFREQFKDIYVDVEETVSEADYEVARCHVTATHIPTGRKVDFNGLGMAKIKDGKIVLGWNHFDFDTMNKQWAG